MTPAILPCPFRSNLLAAALAVFGFATGCNAAPDTVRPVVEWSPELAPTDPQLRSYRLKPTLFSAELVGRLKDGAKITDAHKITLDAEFDEPGAVGFVQPDTNASLVVYPESGLLTLSDEQAEGDPTKEPIAVPTEAEARALADTLLETLGLPLTELRLRTPGGERHVLYSKQNRQKAPKKAGDPENAPRTYVRGVHYFQALGGVDSLTGDATRGIDVWFGTEGRISLLQINWASSEVAGVSPSVSRSEIEQRMLAGEGAWRSPLPADVQTLRVTGQRVIYRDPVKLAGVVVPSLQLTVQVESAGGTLPNVFTCSALADVGADEKKAP